MVQNLVVQVEIVHGQVGCLGVGQRHAGQVHAARRSHKDQDGGGTQPVFDTLELKALVGVVSFVKQECCGQNQVAALGAAGRGLESWLLLLLRSSSSIVTVLAVVGIRFFVLPLQFVVVPTLEKLVRTRARSSSSIGRRLQAAFATVPQVHGTIIVTVTVGIGIFVAYASIRSQSAVHLNHLRTLWLQAVNVLTHLHDMGEFV